MSNVSRRSKRVGRSLQSRVLAVILFLYERSVKSDAHDIPADVKTAGQGQQTTTATAAEVQAASHFGAWCWRIVLEFDLNGQLQSNVSHSRPLHADAEAHRNCHSELSPLIWGMRA